ncbi:MAG: hypothetical protein SCALA701_27490 [Candidatus Scalindua sp.]|nr:MAG: hypothetical protein SCALA701_27490 [Candidatus Scalindua sp.]
MFVVVLLLITYTNILKAESLPSNSVKEKTSIHEDTASEKTDNNINTQGQTPIIFFETPNFDFGKIFKGQKVEHVFEFENRGKTDLEISKVKSSCGCTATIVTNKIVPPGERGEIKTTFHSNAFHGRITKSITVISNASNKPIYQLTISGEVIEVINAYPKRINFASVYIGSEMDRTISVTSDSPFRINKLTVSIPFLTASIKAVNESEYTINVSSTGKHEIGRFNGAIFLKTDNNIQPRVTIPIFGDIIGDITTHPKKLYYGNIKKGNERTQKLFVKFNKENIKILGVKVTPDYLSTKIIENYKENRSQFLIEVKLHENASIGKLNGLLEINTNSKVQPVIKVPIAGEVM